MIGKVHKGTIDQCATGIWTWRVGWRMRAAIRSFRVLERTLTAEQSHKQTVPASKGAVRVHFSRSTGVKAPIIIGNDLGEWRAKINSCDTKIEKF